MTNHNNNKLNCSYVLGMNCCDVCIVEVYILPATENPSLILVISWTLANLFQWT